MSTTYLEAGGEFASWVRRSESTTREGTDHEQSGEIAAIAAVALACVSGAQAVEIQTVSVGNPGNPGDTRYPDLPVTSFGGVA